MIIAIIALPILTFVLEILLSVALVSIRGSETVAGLDASLAISIITAAIAFGVFMNLAGRLIERKHCR